MKRKLIPMTLAAVLSVGFAMHSLTASATLKPGDVAPPFTADASLGGKTYTYSLADELKKGPVVLYFYPAAFTKGCTIEAHEFAEAAGEGADAALIAAGPDVPPGFAALTPEVLAELNLSAAAWFGAHIEEAA